MEKSRLHQLGLFVQTHSQILSGLIIGVCSLSGAIIAATIISSGVEKGVDRGLEGREDVVVTVQGFDSRESTDRLVIAHNYGEVSGILLPDVVIVTADGDGNELSRHSESLNEGVSGFDDANPFMLPRKEGRRYYLGRPTLPVNTERCFLEFQVMQRDGVPRDRRSSPFKCLPNPK